MMSSTTMGILEDRAGVWDNRDTEACSSLLVPERLSPATAALAPPSHLPALRAFRVVVLRILAGLGPLAWPGLGKDPESVARLPLLPPAPQHLVDSHQDRV